MKKKILFLFFTLISFVSIALFITQNASMHGSSSYQWYLNSSNNIDINACEMWKLLSNESLCKKEVIVAIIDTGIDYNHEDLKNIFWINEGEIENDNIDNDKNGYVDDMIGWNFVDDSNNVLEGMECDNNHGTSIAGIIAAQHNEKGIDGIVNSNIKLMSLKVLSGIERSGNIQDVIAAIKYAEMMGAVICNLSFSCEVDDEELRDVMKNSNMLFVVSAGNGINNHRVNIDIKNFYPACYNLDNVITVANLDQNGQLYKTSNYGPNSVDIAAPGTDIYSTIENNRYSCSTGTSMAAPMVTGIAALIYLYSDHIDSKQIKYIIVNTATYNRVLENKVISNGYLNGEAAIEKTLLRMY